MRSILTVRASAAALASMAALAGCSHDQHASTPGAERSASADTSATPHGECLVCKYNADLACVDVPVDADTPRTEWNGQTYYFCSPACKVKFEKNPQKYVAR